MAKGLEDTALYRYYPVLSLNAVGGDPDWARDSVTRYFAYLNERKRTTPFSMNASGTHDTKRAEDVRARIDLVAARASDWISSFEQWSRTNEPLKTVLNASPSPSRATEYFVYETLLGSWPLSGEANDGFCERMREYFLKAAREAKWETSWLEPNAEYEKALEKFVNGILRSASAQAFHASFASWCHESAFFGALHSLSNTALKILAPGLADIYQGSELWDLSLVDPDNRRPVDYEERERLLLRSNDSPESLLKNWKTGAAKLALIRRLLGLRQSETELFATGEFMSLYPSGARKELLVAGLWRPRLAQKNPSARWILWMLPRGLGASPLKYNESLSIPAEFWSDTELALPPGAPQQWRSALDPKTLPLELQSRLLRVASLQDPWPVKVLRSDQPSPAR
jgi:(1->4)-alpha-D-glucan 1-alpha-D-glucosylmutase